MINHRFKEMLCIPIISISVCICVCLRDTIGGRSDTAFEPTLRNVVVPSAESRNARLQKMSARLPTQQIYNFAHTETADTEAQLLIATYSSKTLLRPNILKGQITQIAKLQVIIDIVCHS